MISGSTVTRCWRRRTSIHMRSCVLSVLLPCAAMLSAEDFVPFQNYDEPVMAKYF
jgi:hypothetical protein